MNNIKVDIAGELIDIDNIRLENGVIIPYSKEEEEEIKNHFEGFISFRNESKEWITDPKTICGLPDSVDSRTWKNKSDTIRLIRSTIAKQFKQKKVDILLVGSGNGWLANNLAKDGHDVLGIGVVYYQYDGLETISVYDTKFKHMLLHAHEIDRIKGLFDVIIFENNLPYVKAVFKTLNMAKELLRPSGLVICAAINTSQEAEETRKTIEKSIAYFKNDWNHQLNTYNTKMYFDSDDLEQLKTIEFHVKIRRSFRNKINHTLSRKVVIFDAFFQNS